MNAANPQNLWSDTETIMLSPKIPQKEEKALKIDVKKLGGPIKSSLKVSCTYGKCQNQFPSIRSSLSLRITFNFTFLNFTYLTLQKYVSVLENERGMPSSAVL